ncbi:hypothetical protein BWI17_09390 [Betaproteobacteria bacterium GR16-43]|nr:hypothetical protein BWI17_09390 [Betaproteobacteria bacterium GR16-43]
MKTMHFILAIAIAVAVSSGRAEEDIDTLPAQEAARAWLAIVDAGAYGDSWDQGAKAFQEKVPKADWEKALVAARGAMGKLILRKSRSVTYAKSLPNAPEGEYVVIQYETAFENRNAIETVTPMKAKDGVWRVSGYFIK